MTLQRTPVRDPARGRRAPSPGFTLLEVVVAFAIAALVLAMLTAAVAGGLRSSYVAAQTEQALARARSHLDAVLDPKPGDSGGDDGGGYAWHLRVRAAAVATPSADGGPRPALYDLRAEVSWGAGESKRQVALDTLRLGRAP